MEQKCNYSHLSSVNIIITFYYWHIVRVCGLCACVHVCVCVYL